jgi:hypothetical protein
LLKRSAYGQGDVKRNHNLDNVGPVGGDGENKFLEEMNEMEEGHDQHIQDIGPNVTVH